jgi:hypothetical protein
VSGGNRITLFRETSNEPGLHFRSAAMELRLWGDDLMLEQGARKLHCIRTDQA